MKPELRFLLIIILLFFIITLSFAYLIILAPKVDLDLTKTPETTVRTTTTTSTLPPTSTTTSTSQTSTSTTSTTTTTIVFPKNLELELSDKKLFKNDEVEVKVTAEGIPVKNAMVYLDGFYQHLTGDDGIVIIHNLNGGNHEVKAEKKGYYAASKPISVNMLPYTLSSDVKQQKSTFIRNKLLKEGKVLVRVYDQPNCAYCRSVKQSLSDIVNRNRDCISYEVLNIIFDGPREEAKSIIGGKTFITPLVIIEGNGISSTTTGLQRKSILEGRIKSASSYRCEIE